MDRPAPPPADPPSDELPLAVELPEPASGGRQPPGGAGRAGGVSPLLEREAAGDGDQQGADAPRSPQQARHHHSHSVRLFLVASVGFVCVFLFLRTLTVEPFGVPTGSMAPALIGNHREGACPRCGFPVRVGVPSNLSSQDQERHFSDATCPNCGKQHVDLRGVPTVHGDRLLVDKNVFGLRKPRRWEVAVFWRLADPNDPHPLRPEPSPLQRPDIPYVKRVIGLPGEVITIVDGDVYANGELLRKGLAEVRETRVLVFDQTYAPKAAGWAARWLVEPVGGPRPKTPVTADGTVLDGTAIVLDGSGGKAVGLTYRHWNLDEKKPEPVRTWDGYNGASHGFAGAPAAHDFVLVCEVELPADTGQGTFAARLFDGADSVTAELGVGKGGAVRVGKEGQGVLAEAGRTLEPGRTYKLEFAFVDRRVSLAVDGKELIPAADLPAVAKRGEVGHPLQLGAAGCKVMVRNLKLYRDIHYTHYGVHGTRQPATLGPRDYFMLGDNSGNSEDSRKWPNPGVPESDFIGKPFLIHQPLRLGRVTVAGRDRTFQTLDWSRLRWLH